MAERTGYLLRLGLREALRQTLAFLCERKGASSDWEKRHRKSESCEAVSVGNGNAAGSEKCNQTATLKCHVEYPKLNGHSEQVSA